LAVEAEFCLLGPLAVRQGGVPRSALPAKQRVLLATLLLCANQVVSLDELCEAMWGSVPPNSARSTLRNYVKCLRKDAPGLLRSRISTHPGGYLCSVKPGELDIDRFGDLLSSAKAATVSGAFEQAARQLGECLALWRGEPLADVPSDVIRLRELPRLKEMRLQALQARIDVDMRLGKHSDVIAELRKLTVVHPLRERFHAFLMLALYRDGQQAEALAAYRNARRILVDELAAEPGPELRKLVQQILAADPVLNWPPAGRPSRLRRPQLRR
jgi:DNA-binding SARP family transcriptional activator